MTYQKLFALVRKELGHYFASLVGYVVLFAYYAIGGFFFYLILTQTRQASLDQIFGTLTFILMFMTPLITMRLWSEEEKSGTSELLKTSPLTLWEIVLGKYLGVLAFFGMMTLSVFVYFLVILATGDPDLLPHLAHFLGYLLSAMAFLAIGLLCSTMSENQIVAAVLAFGANLVLWVIGYAGFGEDSAMGEVLKYICLFEHTQDFFKGIVDLGHLFYFASLIFLGLFFSVKILESRRA